MTDRLKLKLLPRSLLKGKVGVHFPARINVESPLILEYNNGTYTISIDVNELIDMLTSIINIEFIIDGGGVPIVAGVKGDLEISFGGTITAATLLADQSGSIVMDIWTDAYGNYPPTVADSITAAAKPTLSAALKSQDTTLTGWDRTVTPGDTWRFNVDSAAAVQRVTLSLRVTKDWSV